MWVPCGGNGVTAAEGSEVRSRFRHLRTIRRGTGLSSGLTEAAIHEFITRTKYRVVQDEAGADGVLHGEVVSIETSPVIFNSTTGEVELMLVTIHARVSLIDNKSSKSVYANNDMVFRDEYQISSDVQSFFDEQSPALGRMARDFASKLVANVVENF